jgi:hypothetical protein
MANGSWFGAFMASSAAKSISARQKTIKQLVAAKIRSNVDFLTGATWQGIYEDSLYDAPSKGGLWDYHMPAEDISFKFTRRGKSDATFIADRLIKYNDQDYPERFIGSVGPDGRVVMNSLTDTDVLMGQVDSISGTLSLLFVDDGNTDSSFGSQTAVGTFVFYDVSKSYSSLPTW